MSSKSFAINRPSSRHAPVSTKTPAWCRHCLFPLSTMEVVVMAQISLSLLALSWEKQEGTDVHSFATASVCVDGVSFPKHAALRGVFLQPMSRRMEPYKVQELRPTGQNEIIVLQQVQQAPDSIPVESAWRAEKILVSWIGGKIGLKDKILAWGQLKWVEGIEFSPAGERK